MRHHFWWHVCLFLLELGEHERIFELLISEVKNPESSLVKASPAAPNDIQNIAYLLLTLELYGVHVSLQLNRTYLSAIYHRDIERLGFCGVPSRAAYRPVFTVSN